MVNDETTINNTTKIIEEGSNATKIVEEDGDATKIVEEGGDARKIIGESGDATVDQKTVKEKDWLNDEKLFSGIPKQFKHSASLLLEHMQSNPSINVNQEDKMLFTPPRKLSCQTAAEESDIQASGSLKQLDKSLMKDVGVFSRDKEDIKDNTIFNEGNLTEKQIWRKARTLYPLY
uniref:Uncharacterized protein n=1 Tax=Romanomermis culicivorax TaxID=13658 RepID=A0A915ISD4_ROMCU